MRNLSRILFILLLPIALADCGAQRMYDEGAGQGQTPATVETPGFTSGIAFMEVDDKRVNPFQSHRVKVLPGSHRFHIWLQKRYLGETFHALFPALSATVGSDYYCAKFEALVEPGRTYKIEADESGLALRSDHGEIVTRIPELNPVPFGNVMTSTPTECSQG